MVRTITEIAMAIKSDFVANSTLREVYGLDSNKTFDEQLSGVSLEAAIIYVVAVAAWTVERLSGDFRSEIDTRIKEAYITSHKWYWSKALEYQDGDEINYNDNSLTFGYSQSDDSKRVVRYAAVSDKVTADRTKLDIKVAGANKKAITDDQLTRFKQYIARIGAAGMSYEITSSDALKVCPHMDVYIDPLSIETSGCRVGKPSERPVDKAIVEYLDSLEFGGLFTARALCAVLQKVTGVIEVKFINLKKTDNANVCNDGDVRIVSPTGAFEYTPLPSSITYIATSL